jgi:hypothetical protein
MAASERFTTLLSGVKRLLLDEEEVRVLGAQLGDCQRVRVGPRAHVQEGGYGRGRRGGRIRHVATRRGHRDLDRIRNGDARRGGEGVTSLTSQSKRQPVLFVAVIARSVPPGVLPARQRCRWPLRCSGAVLQQQRGDIVPLMKHR